MIPMTIASRSIAFCMQERGTPAETLAAQVACAKQVQLKEKCGVQFAAKRLFTADQLDWLEAYLAMYGDLGWPLTNKQIAARMTEMLKLQKRVGEHNQPIDVSAKYARKFVKSTPMLKAFKTSNIDLLRSKKATLQVSGFLIHFVP